MPVCDIFLDMTGRAAIVDGAKAGRVRDGARTTAGHRAPRRQLMAEADPDPMLLCLGAEAAGAVTGSVLTLDFRSV